jgi:type VI secretion system secreted protein Hcp
MNKIAVSVALVFIFLTGFAQTSFAAVEMFLKIEGVDGESLDVQHRNEIDVLAWSWGASNATKGGKPNFQDLSFKKFIDSSSVPLLALVATGQPVQEATLFVRKPGVGEYLKFILKDITITSVSSGGSGGEDRLTENVTIRFGSY